MFSITTVDRYVLRGLVGPFSLSIAGFMVIALSGELYGLMSLIVEKHVPSGDVMRLLLYRLPDLFVMAIPIALLFAVLMNLGRMSKDSELTVIFMSGCSLVRLAVPLWILGVVASVGVYGLNEYIVPETNHQAQQIVRELILKDVMGSAKQEVFFRGTDNRYFYLGYVDKSTMEIRDILVFDVKGSKPDTIIFAENGLMAPHQWTLENGVIQKMDRDGMMVSQTRFDKMSYRVEDEISSFVGEQRTAMEMSRSELARLIELYRSSGVNMRSFKVDYEFKLALPFACLVFALSGTALSLGARHNGRFYSVALSVGLAFAYYVMSAFTKSLGNMGTLSPLVAAWAPNMILLTVGLILIIKADSTV